MRQRAIVARGVTASRNRRTRFFVVGSMKLLLVAVSLLALSCGGRAESAPPSADDGVVVLELFTSQGCSSCPPADSLLTRLGSEPALRGRVVPLSFHVDYWDHIGWRDPFSSAEWSERQRAYAASLHGEAYTPQLVVNGSSAMVGSSERTVRAAIAAGLQTGPQARLHLNAIVGADGDIVVDVSGAQSSDTALEVWVALVEDDLTTRVARGENGGRTLRNDNVVRVFRRAMTLRPRSDGAGRVTIAPDRAWKLERVKIVAFAQDRSSRRIAGATTSRVAFP